VRRLRDENEALKAQMKDMSAMMARATTTANSGQFMLVTEMFDRIITINMALAAVLDGDSVLTHPLFLTPASRGLANSKRLAALLNRLVGACLAAGAGTIAAYREHVLRSLSVPVAGAAPVPAVAEAMASRLAFSSVVRDAVETNFKVLFPWSDVARTTLAAWLTAVAASGVSGGGGCAGGDPLVASLSRVAEDCVQVGAWMAVTGGSHAAAAPAPVPDAAWDVDVVDDPALAACLTHACRAYTEFELHRLPRVVADGAKWVAPVGILLAPRDAIDDTTGLLRGAPAEWRQDYPHIIDKLASQKLMVLPVYALHPVTSTASNTAMAVEDDAAPGPLSAAVEAAQRATAAATAAAASAASAATAALAASAARRSPIAALPPDMYAGRAAPPPPGPGPARY